MNTHNVLDQAPTVCTVITLASSVGRRNRIDLEGTELNTVYLRRKLPVTDEINWEFVDLKKLRNFMNKYPQTVRAYLRDMTGV